MGEMSKNGWANEALAALTQSKVNCLLRAHRGRWLLLQPHPRSLPSPTLSLSNTHSSSLSVVSECQRVSVRDLESRQKHSEGRAACRRPWTESARQKIKPSRYPDRYLKYPAFLQWPPVLSFPVMKNFIEPCTSNLTPQWNRTVIFLSSQRYDLQYEGSASRLL